MSGRTESITMTSHIVYGYKCELPNENFFHDKCSGKIVYIGATTKSNSKMRNFMHIRGDSGAPKFNAFVQLLEMDGIDVSRALTRVILWEGKSSGDYAGKMESKFIKEHDTVNNGFNVNRGGYSGVRKDYSNVPKELLKSHYTPDEISEMTGYETETYRIMEIAKSGSFDYVVFEKYGTLIPKPSFDRYLEFRDSKLVKIGEETNGACALWVNKKSAMNYLKVNESKLNNLAEKGMIISDVKVAKIFYVPSLISYNKNRERELSISEFAKFIGETYSRATKFIYVGLVKKIRDSSPIKISIEEAERFKKVIEDQKLLTTMACAGKMLGVSMHSIMKMIDSGELETRKNPLVVNGTRAMVYLPSINFHIWTQQVSDKKKLEMMFG